MWIWAGRVAVVGPTTCHDPSDLQEPGWKPLGTGRNPSPAPRKPLRVARAVPSPRPPALSGRTGRGDLAQGLQLAFPARRAVTLQETEPWEGFAKQSPPVMHSGPGHDHTWSPGKQDSIYHQEGSHATWHCGLPMSLLQHPVPAGRSTGPSRTHRAMALHRLSWHCRVFLRRDLGGLTEPGGILLLQE